MKIIAAPDKFKGSLTSLQACNAINAGILQVHKNAAIHLFPMADGGDGFAAVLKHYLHTETIGCKTVDPLQRELDTSYEWDAIHKTAIIELALASGLMLLKGAERNPLKTSTYGTGLLIKAAIENGAAKIILGLGGSATNDAGMGILAALGFRFIDESDETLFPSGENLQRVKNIIPPSVKPSVQFIIACDVQNVLYGEAGAAVVYAPQKGADESAVKLLDEGAANFAGIVQSLTRKDIAGFAGSGAAGGVAAGLSAYFNTEIMSGAAMISTIAGIEKQLVTADLIITGEGKMDGQTNEGKVVDYIASLGSKYNVPVIACCGIADITQREIKRIGLLSVIALADEHTSTETSISNAAELLTNAAARVATGFNAGT
ncbi:MAG: glycerate kinase [Chitinophagaceae bacterium]|nr:glycerate kinase [Chitinophagaceae bacterium]